MGNGADRPIGAWVAAALLVVLSITSIHGAASAAVPAGAVATAHASVGAALLQSAASTGRAGADEFGADSTDRQRSYQELDRPDGGGELPAVGLMPAIGVVLLHPPVAATGGRDTPPASRTVSERSTRAPPK